MLVCSHVETGSSTNCSSQDSPKHNASTAMYQWGDTFVRVLYSVNFSPHVAYYMRPTKFNICSEWAENHLPPLQCHLQGLWPTRQIILGLSVFKHSPIKARFMEMSDKIQQILSAFLIRDIPLSPVGLGGSPHFCRSALQWYSRSCSFHFGMMDCIGLNITLLQISPQLPPWLLLCSFIFQKLFGL